MADASSSRHVMCPFSFGAPDVGFIDDDRVCDSCLKDDVLFAAAPPTGRCMHVSTICTRCLIDCARSALGSESTEVRCPVEGCDEVLTYDEVVEAAQADYTVFINRLKPLSKQTRGGSATPARCDCHMCSRRLGDRQSTDLDDAIPGLLSLLTLDKNEDGKPPTPPSSPSHSVRSVITNDHIADPVPNRTCAVCSEDNVTARTPSSSSRCAHDMVVCNNCLFEHVRIAISDYELVEIECLVEGCGVVLTYNEVCCAARNDRILVERFDSLQMKQALGSDDNFVWCMNPDYGSGQYHEGGIEAPIVTCFRCNTKSCFEHKIIWHEDQTCSEYNVDNRVLDQASTEFIELNTKGCPGCHSRIEKNAGCDHMTCTRCRHEFCWICLADYNAIRQHGNSRHNEGCNHYRE